MQISTKRNDNLVQVPGEAHAKILTGMLVLFFGGLKFGHILFFWVGKFFSYFFWVSQNFRYFLGSDKFPAILLGLPIFVSHT